MNFKCIKLIVFLIFTLAVTKGYSKEYNLYFFQGEQLEIDDIRDLSTSRWELYKKPVFEDKDHSTLWFKIEFNKLESNTYYIDIPSIFIKSSELYLNNKSIKQKLGRANSFTLKNKNEPVYLKVITERRSFIPVDIYSETSFFTHISNKKILYTSFNTFAFAIFFFTLLYYFQHKENTYLFYVGMMFSVNIARYVAEGYLLLLVDTALINILLDHLTHFVVTITGMYFAISYLDLIPEKAKRMQKVVYLNLVLAAFTLVPYVITTNSWYAFLSYCFVLFALISIQVIAYSEFKSSTYAKFYCIAFLPLMIAGIDVYFFEKLGIKSYHMNHLQYRVSIVFEMIVLSIAVAYRGKAIVKENEKMKKSIQNMSTTIADLAKIAAEENKSWKLVIMQEYNLTKQEFVVLENILKMKKNKDIADELFLSLNTIKFHTRNIYKKLEVNNKKQAIELVEPMLN